MPDNKVVNKQEVQSLPTLNKLLIELYNTFYQYFRFGPMKIEYSIPPPRPISDSPLRIVLLKQEMTEYLKPKRNIPFTSMNSGYPCGYAKLEFSNVQIYEMTQIHGEYTIQNGNIKLESKASLKQNTHIQLTAPDRKSSNEFEKSFKRKSDSYYASPRKLSFSIKTGQEQPDVEVILPPKCEQPYDFSYISQVKTDQNCENSSQVGMAQYIIIDENVYKDEKLKQLKNRSENTSLQNKQSQKDIELEENRESKVVLPEIIPLYKSNSDIQDICKNQNNYLGTLKNRSSEFYDTFMKNIHIEPPIILIENQYSATESEISFQYTSKHKLCLSKKTQTVFEDTNPGNFYRTVFYEKNVTITTEETKMNPEMKPVNYIFPRQTTGPFHQDFNLNLLTPRSSIQYIVAPKTNDIYEEKSFKNNSYRSFVTNLRKDNKIKIQKISPENENLAGNAIHYFMVPAKDYEPIEIKQYSVENLDEGFRQDIILEEERIHTNKRKSERRIHESRMQDTYSEIRMQPVISENYLQVPKEQEMSKMPNMDILEFLALRNRLSELHNNLLLNINVEPAPTPYGKDSTNPLLATSSPLTTSLPLTTSPPLSTSLSLSTIPPTPTDTPSLVISTPKESITGLLKVPETDLKKLVNFLPTIVQVEPLTGIKESAELVELKRKPNELSYEFTPEIANIQEKTWTELYKHRNLKDEQTQTDLHFVDTLNPLELEDQRQKEFEKRLLSTLSSTENLLTLHSNVFGNKATEVIQTMHSPIDYVLVCTLNNYETRNEITAYLKNLSEDGVENIVVTGLDNPKLVFILLHAAPTCLQHFAHVYQIEQRYRNTNFVPEDIANIKCMENDLTKRVEESPIAHRNPLDVASGLINFAHASRIYSVELHYIFITMCDHVIFLRELFLTPDGPISSERVMILHKLLSRTTFSNNEYGLKNMIKKRHFLTAYPLHDGDCDWPTEGPVKFRQALLKYWGSMSNIFKYQPLNTIEKYYGGEVAMFFAWCGFYNTMLFPAAVLGIILFLSGFISFFTYDAERSLEICQYHYPVCPICKEIHVYCKFVDLSLYCTYAKLTYFFDNTFTVILAIVMVFWSVIFMELWKRHEAMFKLRWNLYNFSADTYLRNSRHGWRVREILLEEHLNHFQEESLPNSTEFTEKTKYRRKSKITGVLEAYVPMRIKLITYVFTICICFLVCGLVVAGIFCGILLRLHLHTALMSHESDTISLNVQLITVTCSSILCLIIIRIFKLFIGRLALWLTEIENPRTQLEFDNSFIYKLVVLSFMNVYLPLFYLSMVKSTMHTTPYDWSHGSVFQSDVCHPAGCIMSLCIQIYFLFIDKGIAVKLLEYFGPILLFHLKKCICKRNRQEKSKQLPLWEKDFYLKKTERYYLAYDYLHQVTQYGLLTFFIASFPLAPIYAFISNTLQLRIFAWKLLKKTRRPVPRRLPGIGLWTPIMTFMTWISVITNAIIIAFTSEFINRELHKYWTGSLEGFINASMSIFAIDDYELVPRIGEGLIECYYRGERNPPSHPLKYQRRPDYWKKLSGKVLFVVLFIHILLVVTGILAYSIPDVPFTVKEHRNYEQKKLTDLKIKQMNDKFKRAKYLSVQKRRGVKEQQL